MYFLANHFVIISYLGSSFGYALILEFTHTHSSYWIVRFSVNYACACTAAASRTDFKETVISLHIQCEARFPFKRNRLRCVRCVNENRKKRKRLRWQAANHDCHCFDRAFLLAGACVCCVKTNATQAIAFEWKPSFTLNM